MYKMVTTTTPTARLNESGTLVWDERGKYRARFRTLVKRRLRRRCMETGARTWRVLDVNDVVVEQGVIESNEA